MSHQNIKELKKMRLLLSTIFTVVLLFIMMPVDVALADQDNPDDIPSMTADVYRNLLETGDQLYIFYANIPYTSIPDALVTEAFSWRLIDTDNLTVLGQTVGTAFIDSGYGYNVFSMYLTAADAPTWDQPYLVKLTGNPMIFDSPPEYNFNLNTENFNTQTVTAEVQTALVNRVLAIAIDLDIRWGLIPAESLVTEQETGTALSLNGEAFFRGAIFGLQAMAPRAFQIVIGTITAVDRTWDTEYSTNVTTQYTGTFIEIAQTAGATMFNKGYDLLSIIMLLVILVALMAGNLLITRSIWSGMIDITLVSVLFARIGVPAVLLSFLGLVGASCWIYISGKVWGVWR